MNASVVTVPTTVHELGFILSLPIGEGVRSATISIFKVFKNSCKYLVLITLFALFGTCSCRQPTSRVAWPILTYVSGCFGHTLVLHKLSVGYANQYYRADNRCGVRSEIWGNVDVRRLLLVDCGRTGEFLLGVLGDTVVI